MCKQQHRMHGSIRTWFLILTLSTEGGRETHNTTECQQDVRKSVHDGRMSVHDGRKSDHDGRKSGHDGRKSDHDGRKSDTDDRR